MASTLNASTTLGLISSADTSGVLQLQTASTTAVTINASQNVGIGTSSPAQKLNVVGNVLIEPSATFGYAEIKNQTSTAGSILRFTNGSTTSYFGKENSTGTYTWSSGGVAYATVISAYGSTAPIQFGHNTPSLTLDSSGNLGLGVTPSATSAKHFQGPASFFIGPQGDGLYLMSNAYYNSGFKYATTDVASYYSQSAGQHRFYNAASGTAGNAITFTQAMTLDASGNLLVGTTSATYSAANRGVFELNGASTAINALKIGGSAAGYTYHDGSVMSIGNVLNGAFAMFTNSTERARIDSSGNLLIGASSFADGSNVFRISGSTITSGSSVTTTRTRLEFNSSGLGTVGSISTNGSATTYSTSSDYRLKNITGALTGYKERLMSLLPKQGTWVVDGSEFRGFVAHDFANPYPKSVVGEKDAVDSDGKPIMQSMQASSSEVMADLVAMVKDLVTENESLKARLDAANL
jgi:hypothetical protein